jgi:hypothetical protein
LQFIGCRHIGSQRTITARPREFIDQFLGREQKMAVG